MPEWIIKMTCAKCKKKGRLAFNCPPKYGDKVRKIADTKYPSNNNVDNKNTTNNEQATNVTEFAGHTQHISSKYGRRQTCNSSKSFLCHELRIFKLCGRKDKFHAKRNFYRLIFQDNMKIRNTITKEIRKLGRYDLTTILWILSYVERKYRYKHNSIRRKLNKYSRRKSKYDLLKNKARITHDDITPPQSNVSSNEECGNRMDSTLAFNVEHELHSQNNLP